MEKEVFQLIQVIGIVLSFLLSFFAFLYNIKVTKVNNGLLIAHYHREIWLEYCRNDNLNRIFKMDVDLNHVPLTDQEKQFVNMIFIHIEESLSATNRKSAYKIEGLKDDIIDILSYPIPMNVWQENKNYHDKFFFDFIENIIQQNALPTEFNNQKIFANKRIIKSRKRKKYNEFPK